MASVDRDGLEQGLDALVERGVLLNWARRPLGLYWLYKITGERLDLDTKKAAVWFEGAAYCGAVVEAQQELREALNHEEDDELAAWAAHLIAYETFLKDYEDHGDTVTLGIDEYYAGAGARECTYRRRDAYLYLKGAWQALGLIRQDLQD